MAMINCPQRIGKYEFIDIIGVGSFGSVYKAMNMENRQILAVKTIAKEKILNEEEKDQLQREIDTMSVLKHENIVSLLDYFEDTNYCHIVMEYCHGGTVFSFFQDGHKLREDQACSIFTQLVRAISYCHKRGVAHRDLKPHNILFTNFPNIKITDFGLCAYTNSGKMKTFCGSPCYASPECLQHLEYDGILSDLWSLGVILYELVTAHHPWNIENQNMMIQSILKANFSIPKTISHPITEIIFGLMKVRPRERLSIDKILESPWIMHGKGRKEPCPLPKLSQKLESVEEMIKRIPRKRMMSDMALNPIIPAQFRNETEKNDEKCFKLSKTRSPSQIFKSSPNFSLSSSLMKKKEIYIVQI